MVLLDPTPRFVNKNPRVPDFFTPKYYDPARSISPGKITRFYKYIRRNPGKTGGLVGTITGTLINQAIQDSSDAQNAFRKQASYTQYQKRRRQFRRNGRRNNQHHSCCSCC